MFNFILAFETEKDYRETFPGQLGISPKNAGKIATLVYSVSKNFKSKVKAIELLKSMYSGNELLFAVYALGAV